MCTLPLVSPPIVNLKAGIGLDHDPPFPQRPATPRSAPGAAHV